MSVDEFAAGTGRVDITPPPGIAHANWGAQTHERAAAVDMPLWATALALSDGARRTVIVDLDLLGLWPGDARRTRSAVADLTGLPESNVRLSYTHTHSGPSVNRDTWAERGAEMIDPYLRALPHRVAGAAWRAMENRRPARLAAGTGTCDIAVNRRFRRPEDGALVIGRNPDGPVDHDVDVLRIDGADGDPIAAVVTYACHPIIVGPDNDRITPDYPGATKRVVEDATGATCLFLQGAAGDVGPVWGLASGGIEEYRPLGNRLGHAASRVWWGLDPRERREEYVETLPSGAPLAVYRTVEPDPPERRLSVRSREVPLPLRDLPDPDAADAEYERLTERLRERREAGADEATVRAAAAAARQAEIRAGVARRFAGREHEPWEVQVVGIGEECALAAVPGEPFVHIGRAVKERSPVAHTLFSGYSNVGVGYVPTADAYLEGGYAVETTPFAPEAAATLVDAVVDALSG